MQRLKPFNSRGRFAASLKRCPDTNQVRDGLAQIGGRGPESGEMRPPLHKRLVRGEAACLHAGSVALHDVIERGAQAAVVVIFQRHKTERL
jgi:hypothetical protein